MKKLTIGHLYPDLLNLYGDRGNIQCFRKRLEWRGMEAEVIPFLSGEKIDFSKLDIVLLGGGSDREQELVCGFLKDIKDDFKAYVEDGGVVLAVCGGYQLLGKYYKTNKKTIEGLSILDITTEWQPERLIRNIVCDFRFGLFIVCGMRACSWIDPGGNLHVWNKIHEEFRGNAGVASGSGLCSDHDGKWKCRNRRSSCGSV